MVGHWVESMVGLKAGSMDAPKADHWVDQKVDPMESHSVVHLVDP